MNALKLASLVSATLSLLTPLAIAQAEHAMPEPKDATVVQTEPTDVTTYKEHKIAGIGEEPESQRPYRADPRYALKLYMTVVDAGVQLHVDPSDGSQAWIVVCFDTEAGLIPAAILDARDGSQTTLGLSREEFGELPLALFAVRFSADGFLEFSMVREAHELAEDAQH